MITCGNLNCKNVFEPRSPNQGYCSIKCREGAYRHRARLRTGNELKSVVDNKVAKIANNPTVQQLNLIGKMVLEEFECPRGKFIKCTGFVPAWTPPTGVLFIHQMDNTWLVMTKETHDKPNIQKPPTTIEDLTPRFDARKLLPPDTRTFDSVEVQAEPKQAGSICKQSKEPDGSHVFMLDFEKDSTGKEKYCEYCGLSKSLADL